MRLQKQRTLILTTMLFLSACLPTAEQLSETASTAPTAALATPVADSPAAGICAEHEGELVSVTIRPDIPDPRCSYVRPDQLLRVVNQREEILTVSLAGLETEIAPGDEHVFEQPFGSLLMPGVHRFDVSPCCGAELILNANR
jgi:hypothetical protein